MKCLHSLGSLFESRRRRERWRKREREGKEDKRLKVKRERVRGRYLRGRETVKTLSRGT